MIWWRVCGGVCEEVVDEQEVVVVTPVRNRSKLWDLLEATTIDACGFTFLIEAYTCSRDGGRIGIVVVAIDWGVMDLTDAENWPPVDGGVEAEALND